MGDFQLPDNYLRIAKCGKVVGLKGEISLWPISNVDERFVASSQYFLDDGSVLTVEKIRWQKDHYVVLFEGHSRREDVEGLVNAIVYGEPLDQDLLEEGEFFVHDCVGKTLIDQDGASRGKAVKYIPNAASDLLETDDGVLIPFRFISRVDENNVYLDAPEGLFDVNDKDFS